MPRITQKELAKAAGHKSSSSISRIDHSKAGLPADRLPRKLEILTRYPCSIEPEDLELVDAFHKLLKNKDKVKEFDMINHMIEESIKDLVVKQT